MAEWRASVFFEADDQDDAEEVFHAVTDLACDCDGSDTEDCRFIFGVLREVPADCPEPEVEVTFDPEADAGYVYLDDSRPVHRTIDLEHGVLIDLDADDHVVGIELLGLLRPSLASALAGKASRSHR